MAKIFSILKKPNGNEAHPLMPAADGEDELNEKNTTKHTWKIFKVLSKTWKSGKSYSIKSGSSLNIEHLSNSFAGKRSGNDTTGGITETYTESAFGSVSAPVRNETEINPFGDSASEFDLSETCTKNSNDNDEASNFGRSLLNKMSLQKLMGIFASANRKRQELLKHKINKNEVHLDKAKTFIVGQGPFKQEDSVSFLAEEERDIYDVKYEDVIPSSARSTTLSKSTMSITNISMMTKLSAEGGQFNSTSTPVNSPQDQTQTFSEHSNALNTDADDVTDEEGAQSETLDLLQSVCDRLISHDFNTCDNASSLNISANGKMVENNSGSALDVDLESDSGEEPECESPNSMTLDPNDVDHNGSNKENTEEPVENICEKCSEEFLGWPKNEEIKNDVIGDVKDLGKMRLRLNTIQNLYTSLNAEKSETLPVIKETSHCEIKEERTENQKTYSIVEDDIKCMIKELLDESKTIKETIVSTGIAEEAEPPFTCTICDDANLTVYDLCKNICDELINAVTTSTCKKTFNVPNRKNIFTSKETTNTAVSDVRYIINVLLEQVLRKWPKEKIDYHPERHFVSVNYCLINDAPMYNSKIYSAANKFCQTNKNHSSKAVALKLPMVTIRNLSSTPKISVFKTDDKLVNRVRKSAALLLALYEEMRDYSYRSTSRLFNDLYETINLLDLSKHVVEHPKPNRLTEKKSAPQVNSDNPKSEPAINPKEIIPEEKEVEETKPESSCSKSTSKTSYDVFLACSDSSLCSSESSDDAAASSILPNLKYTYLSDEEVNSVEEIKKIETNATENSMRNASLRTTDEEFSLGLDAVDEGDDDVTNSFNDDDVLDEGKSENGDKDGGNL